MSTTAPKLVEAEPLPTVEVQGQGNTVEMAMQQLVTLEDVIRWASYHDGEIKQKWKNADAFHEQTSDRLGELREMISDLKEHGRDRLGQKITELYAAMEAQNLRQDARDRETVSRQDATIEALEADTRKTIHSLRLEMQGKCDALWAKVWKIGAAVAGLVALGGGGLAAIGG